VAVINPHLTLTAYGDLKPGDRVINGLLNPTRPDAHLLARPVREIVRTYRKNGAIPNWALPLTERVGRHTNPHGYKRYACDVIVWRDTNGSLFEDRADEPVYIASA
jgi:hypothetical protein